MTLDDARIEETRSLLGEVTFAKFLHRLEDETNTFIACINSGAALTSEEIGLRCHTLASSAGLYGARDLRVALLAAEEAAKTNDLSEISSATQGLAAIWSDTQRDLQALV